MDRRLMPTSVVLLLWACISSSTNTFAQNGPTECEISGSEWPEARLLDIEELDNKRCSILIFKEGDHLISSTSALPKVLCTIKGTSFGGKSVTVYLRSPLKPTCANVTFSGSLNFKALGQTSCVQGATSTVRISEDANVLFNGCQAITKGGGIIAQAVELAGVASFDSCHAGKDGGALYVQDRITILQGASLLINNCSASGIGWINGGGGIYSKGSMMVMGQVSFKNCNARHGACVRTQKDMMVSDSAEAVFSNCSSAYWGGGMRVEGNLKLSGHAVFNTCSARFAGGAFRSKGVVTMSGNIVFNNCSSVWGGAMNAQNGVHIVENAKVTYNGCYARYDGGGVLCIGSFKVVAGAELTFNSCSAGRTGGGVRVESATSSIVSLAKGTFTSFTHCRALEGGGIYIMPKLKVTTSNTRIELEGDIDFDSCSASIGSGVRMVEADGYAHFGDGQSMRFKDMCGQDNAHTLISGPIKRPTNFAIMNNETGWKLTIHERFGLLCLRCEFGKFSMVTNSTIDTSCVSCRRLSEHVDNRRVGCWADVVDLETGVMITRHPSQNSGGESPWVYDSWLCPQKDACPRATIEHAFNRRAQCATGHNNTVTLPACATCSKGYNPAKYDPFTCKKCSGGLHRVALLFPLGFYLLGVFSAGKPRSSMAAIQNIFLTWATSSTLPLSVLESSRSSMDVKSMLKHIHVLSKASGAIPTESCFFQQQCHKFECAHKDLAVNFGFFALVYPCAEIVHRIATRYGVKFGPSGDLLTRLSVHAAIAANYFMPMLVSIFLRFIPCAMVQTNPYAYRVSWFWAEECFSGGHLLWVLAAILGIIACVVSGPVHYYLLIACGPLGRRWAGREEKDEAMGYTLTSYHDGLSKYWDALVLFRKMLFVGLSTVFPLSYNPSLHCVATLGTLTFFFVLHLACRPYHLRHQIHGVSLNLLEDMAQAVPLASGFLALGLLQIKVHWVFAEVFVFLLIFLLNLFAFVTLMYFFIWAVLEDRATQKKISNVTTTLSGLLRQTSPGSDAESPTAWAVAFNDADKNHDGHLDMEDFRHLMECSDKGDSVSVNQNQGLFRALETRFDSLEKDFNAMEHRICALTQLSPSRSPSKSSLERPLLH